MNASSAPAPEYLDTNIDSSIKSIQTKLEETSAIQASSHHHHVGGVMLSGGIVESTTATNPAIMGQQQQQQHQNIMHNHHQHDPTMMSHLDYGNNPNNNITNPIIGMNCSFDSTTTTTPAAITSTTTINSFTTGIANTHQHNLNQTNPKETKPRKYNKTGGGTKKRAGNNIIGFGHEVKETNSNGDNNKRLKQEPVGL